MTAGDVIVECSIQTSAAPLVAYIMSQALLDAPGCAARRVKAQTRHRLPLLPAARVRRTASSLCVCTLSVDRRRVLEERWSRQKARCEVGTGPSWLQ